MGQGGAASEERGRWTGERGPKRSGGPQLPWGRAVQRPRNEDGGPVSEDRSEAEGPGGFRRLGEEIVYRGSLISVAHAIFADPDGGEFRRDVVHHPGAVSVVPVIDEGSAVLMVRQYRAPVDRELLEIPAGKRDVDGEPVELTARRELEEEVGMRAGRLERLAEFYNSPGFCDEHSFVFMALDLEPCA